MKYRMYAVAMCGLMPAFLSCQKDKLDHRYDNRPVQDTRGNSLIRLVNLVKHNQVIAAGDTLTNYVVYRPGGTETVLYPGTRLFPGNGRLGQTWSIPRQLLQGGKLSLMTENLVWPGQGGRDTLLIDVEEEGTKAKDYFLLQSEFITAEDKPRVVELPRSVSAPSKAGHFKIRLVNLAQKLRPQSDPVDDFTRPLTLAYADGTPVAGATSNVAVGAASEYVELPYGAYQFKVLSPEGYEVTAGGGNTAENTSTIDPATGSLVRTASGFPHTFKTHLVYAPLRTFQPGGIYTIVVNAERFDVPSYNGLPGETYTSYLAAFRILSDISEPANASYTRIHAVNALPGEEALSVKIDDQPHAQLGFGQSSGYAVRIRGKARITATDGKGAEIAAAEASLEPNMNYTAWVYRGADGKAAINLVTNNLSGSWYTGGSGADGSQDQQRDDYPFHVRYLNFCADVPYLTFTQDNGQANGNAAVNLQPGVAVMSQPYTRYGQTKQPFQIMAYRSAPGVVPGNWIREIPALKGSDFIARKELYVRGELPALEPGVFTVALIGSMNETAPEARKARMIIVKHTK